MHRRPIFLSLAGLVTSGCFSTSLSGKKSTIDPSGILTPSGNDSENNFGWAVAINDETVAVGAPYADNGYGGGGAGGVVYVYRRSDAGVQESEILIAFDAPEVYSAQFGRSIELHSETFLVGALESIYVFERPSGEIGWAGVEKLVPREENPPISFGEVIAFDGVTAIGGAPFEDATTRNSGAAYVFDRNAIDEEWVSKRKLTGPDGSNAAIFGQAVGVEGNTGLVGAPWIPNADGDLVGEVFVVERDNADSEWRQTESFSIKDAASDCWFGWSLIHFDDIAIVGAPKAENTYGVETGAVFVFERSARGEWENRHRIAPDNTAVNGMFGHSIAHSQHVLLVGSPRLERVDLFQREGDVWRNTGRLSVPGESNPGFFGWSVALSNQTGIVGAPGAESYQSVDNGNVFIFDIEASD